MPALLSPSSSKIRYAEFVTDSKVGTDGRITHVLREGSRWSGRRKLGALPKRMAQRKRKLCASAIATYLFKTNRRRGQGCDLFASRAMRQGRSEACRVRSAG
ncbi:MULTISPECIES: hypothetical protein [Cyanophyceae]|uniref:hypothetical protein n=1 Tax=Cyanophyceae TaxID=3028117 RepID=UPI001686D6ED|nr:hypothetical protein [Trichocoleus sp. FACHB-69]MBD1935640.1 hypothetical protein [Trichocoleus sp. FACHB-69]